MQASGLGSIMSIHFQSGTLTSASDVKACTSLRALLHLELMLRGYYIARRGYLALPLPIDDNDIAGFVEAVDEFVVDHESILTTSRS
jgi:glutamate-1-semialdehyde 2,1-aminomutase